jgi:hypothetical protein
MDEYQEMAIKVYHNPEASFAAKQIAHDLLINSGWSEDDIEACRDKDPKEQIMILLA